jgi:hypothetical protein
VQDSGDGEDEEELQDLLALSSGGEEVGFDGAAYCYQRPAEEGVPVDAADARQISKKVN